MERTREKCAVLDYGMGSWEAAVLPLNTTRSAGHCNVSRSGTWSLIQSNGLSRLSIGIHDGLRRSGSQIIEFFSLDASSGA